jgi:hypothetical protein
MIISRLILLRMRNVSEKNLWRKSEHTFYFYTFFSENCAVYGIITVKYEACALLLNNYGYRLLRICNTDFLRQKRLRERASFLRFYVHYLCFFLLSTAGLSGSSASVILHRNFPMYLNVFCFSPFLLSGVNMYATIVLH